MSSRSIKHQNTTSKTQGKESDRNTPQPEDTTSDRSPANQPTLGNTVDSQSTSDQPESGTNR